MQDTTTPQLTGRLLGLLAFAAGLTVANIYYNQPLLVEMGREFSVSSRAAGGIAVATQLGFASGLLLLVPLGDMLDRKRLIVASAGAASLALVAIAVAPGFRFVVTASYLLGLLCVTPQLIVPYAANLAKPEQRGRVVGIVMAGLLIGILFSRSVAGFLGDWLGWRLVFACAAGLALVIALCLTAIPGSAGASRGLSYGALLGTLVPLLKREPVLRRHATLAFLGFGAFSAFWTTISFYLAARPEQFGAKMVGLIGLVAVAGAVAAPLSGRLSDRFSARAVNGVSLGLMVSGFLVMLLADHSLLWLIVGVFIMDAGAQGSHISNQTRIYQLAPELRNRLTSVYMVIGFLGGAVGSALGAWTWAKWQWPGVCWLGAGLSALAVVILLARRSGNRAIGR